MKKKNYFRKELNLTQEDTAMLLNISRSQWSLYELGLRELSTKALIAESKALGFLSSVEALDQPKILESNKIHFISNAVKENQFQQLLCKRKIDRIQQNYNAALKFFNLVHFAIQSADPNNSLHISALNVLKVKAEETLDKNSPEQLLKLQLKQKMLLYEEKLLADL